MEHLDSFIYSAEDGGFSAAARRLVLTPAGVSKNVARLEQNVAAWQAGPLPQAVLDEILQLS